MSVSLSGIWPRAHEATLSNVYISCAGAYADVTFSPVVENIRRGTTLFFARVFIMQSVGESD